MIDYAELLEEHVNQGTGYLFVRVHCAKGLMAVRARSAEEAARVASELYGGASGPYRTPEGCFEGWVSVLSSNGGVFYNAEDGAWWVVTTAPESYEPSEEPHFTSPSGKQCWVRPKLPAFLQLTRPPEHGGINLSAPNPKTRMAEDNLFERDALFREGGLWGE